MNCHSRIILVICDSYFVSFALKAFNRGPDYLPQPEGEHVHDAMTNGTPGAWLVAYLILVGRMFQTIVQAANLDRGAQMHLDFAA